MIKKITTALLFCILTGASLNVQAANEYVLNYLCTVFCPTQVSKPTFENIRRHDSSVANGINDLYNQITWSVAYFFTFGQEAVDEYVKDQIIDHVKKESFAIADAITNDRQLAIEISNRITTEITSLYNRLPQLSKSVFREYIGSPLHAKVEDYKKKLSHQTASTSYSSPKPQAAPAYHHSSHNQVVFSYSAIGNSNLSSDRTCPICQYDMEINDSVVLPIPGKIIKTQVEDAELGAGYIVEYTSCKHCMHAACAIEAFFNYGQAECAQPHCRKKIDKQLLEQILKINHHLYVPSAPAYSR